MESDGRKGHGLQNQALLGFGQVVDSRSLGLVCRQPEPSTALKSREGEEGCCAMAVILYLSLPHLKADHKCSCIRGAVAGLHPTGRSCCTERP